MLAIVEAFAKGPKGIDSVLDKVGRRADRRTLVRDTRCRGFVLVDSTRVGGTLSWSIDYRNACIDRRCSRSTRKSCCCTRNVDTCHSVDCDCDVDVYVVVRFLVVVVVVLDVVLEANVRVASMLVPFVVHDRC